MIEEWKEIQGYDGKYKISTFGRVYSHLTNKMLTPKINNNGYCGIELFKNGTRKMFLIHRLVALHFIDNKNPSFNVINHKDKNPKNNKVDNLEWCDQKYNCNYSYDEIYGNKNGIKKSKNKDTHKSIIRVSDNAIFDNSLQLKHLYGHNQTSILECCRGIRKTAYGYQWQFA